MRSICEAWPTISLFTPAAWFAISSIVRASSAVELLRPCSNWPSIASAWLTTLPRLSVLDFNARNQGARFIPEDESCLLQGGPLVFKYRQQRANAVFIAAEGTFDRGDLLVDNAFEFPGTMDCVLDAADQQFNFGTHGLGN